MTFPERWQDCAPFVQALVQHDLVRLDGLNVQTFLPNSYYVSSYKLWQDGYNLGKTVGVLKAQ